MPFDRSVLLGLAVLDRIADRASEGPVKRDLAFRAVLAMLHARSNGDRRSYDGFWQVCRSNGISGEKRVESARIELCRILTTLGLPTNDVQLSTAIGLIKGDGRFCGIESAKRKRNRY